MSEPDQILDVLQADLVAILGNAPALANAYIFTGSEKELATRLSKALGTKTVSDEGKRGLAIQVLPISVTDAETNLPGPPINLRCQMLVVENVRINRGAHGTLKTSSQTALNILATLHHQNIGPHALYAEKSPVAPEKIDDGFEAHLVTLYVRANGVQGPGKVSPVHPSEADDLITLTTATADAEIYFTTDGTYPEPANTAATLYTAPIEDAAVGLTFRAAAYKSALNPSDCTEFTTV